MKIYHLIFVLIFIIASCQKVEVPEPTTAIDCNINYSNHIKNADYLSILDKYTSDGIVGLTFLVDHPEDGLWVGASGFADIENRIEMTPCHLHYAASIIKTYIATIILQLEEEGKLSINDQLESYISADILNNIPNVNEVNIKQLLQCRSGIPDVFEVDFLMDLLNQPTQQYTMEELMQFVYGVKAVGAPDERHYYGDANFILLSMIIEKIENTDLLTVYQNRIFQRSNTSNSFLINNPNQLPNGIAASYWDRHGNQVFENISDYQIALAAGLEGTDGLITDAYDLNMFQRRLIDGTLLSASSYEKMIDVVDIPEGESNQNYKGYGLGIGRVQMSDKVWYGSFGNHIGSAAIMLYNPEYDISIIVFQNTGTFFNDTLKQKFFAELILDIEEVAF